MKQLHHIWWTSSRHATLYYILVLSIKIVFKSHDNTGEGNIFLDKQKNLPACPVDKLIYFLIRTLVTSNVLLITAATTSTYPWNIPIYPQVTT